MTDNVHILHRELKALSTYEEYQVNDCIYTSLKKRNVSVYFYGNLAIFPITIKEIEKELKDKTK